MQAETRIETNRNLQIKYFMKTGGLDRRSPAVQLLENRLLDHRVAFQRLIRLIQMLVAVQGADDPALVVVMDLLQ